MAGRWQRAIDPAKGDTALRSGYLAISTLDVDAQDFGVFNRATARDL
jgi:hypothetical protein